MKLKMNHHQVIYLIKLGSKWIWERGQFNGAPQKSSEINKFHVGETITSLQKTKFVSGSQEVILYMTIMGSIGCFIPFSSKDDYEFFNLLELNLRQQGSSLIGRDHLSFRSYYSPVKNVIDGDLCESFNKFDKQNEISLILDKSPDEIFKKVQDLRNKTGF
jgi:splicing factor 3B subunit 3